MSGAGSQVFYGGTRWLEQTAGAIASVGVEAPPDLQEDYTLVWPETAPPGENAVMVVEAVQDGQRAFLTWLVGGGVRLHRQSFGNAELTPTGKLSVIHNFTAESVQVQVWDDRGRLVTPDEVSMVSVNEIEIDLYSFQRAGTNGQLPGTWRAIVTG